MCEEQRGQGDRGAPIEGFLGSHLPEFQAINSKSLAIGAGVIDMEYEREKTIED